MKQILIYSFAIALVTFTACTKGSGPGGQAKIKGKVFARNLDKTLITITDSGYIGDVKVFIAYGDNPSVGDNIETSYDGSFEFPYLREGTYKIWTFGKKRFSNNALDVAVVQDVIISSKKEEKVVADLQIFTNKN